MVTRIADAVSAYSAAAKAVAPGATAAPASGGSFAEMVKSAAEGAIEQLEQGEKMSAQATVGKADLSDVVTAVSNAEVTLQTVVAVRDRVVQAYQEILRMPI